MIDNAKTLLEELDEVLGGIRMNSARNTSHDGRKRRAAESIFDVNTKRNDWGGSWNIFEVKDQLRHSSRGATLREKTMLVRRPHFVFSSERDTHGCRSFASKGGERVRNRNEAVIANTS